MAVVNMDALEFMARLKDGSVDCIVTDPPYESLEKHRAVGTTTRLKNSKASSNAWFDVVPNAYLARFLAEAWRVLKKNTHMYIFCDEETSNILERLVNGVPNFPPDLIAHIHDPLVAAMVTGCDFTWWKRIVWNKEAMGTGYHFRAKKENICFLEKGKRQLTSKSVPDFLDPAELDALMSKKRIYRGYPTEKPPEIAAVLIEQSTEPGDRVVDPFCGSGGTGVSARLLGRRFAGSDTCAEAVTIANARIKEAVDSDAKFDSVA